MNNFFSMKVVTKTLKTLAVSRPCGNGVSIIHTAPYQEGDKILLEVGKQTGYYIVRLDETMPETLIYVKENENGNGLMMFNVPTGDQLISYSPKSFSGKVHVISARKAREEELAVRKNLAFNPYDGHESKGFYPHSSANVETRNEAVFASRNAIDGVFENSSHGAYPFASWGINQDPNAAITIDFGRDVVVDEVRITLRADFPHDNWWTSGEIFFSDDTSMVLNFEKTPVAQVFKFDAKVVNKVVFTNLIKSDEPSPFPALTQIEVYGTEKV